MVRRLLVQTLDPIIAIAFRASDSSPLPVAPVWFCFMYNEDFFWTGWGESELATAYNSSGWNQTELRIRLYKFHCYQYVPKWVSGTRDWLVVDIGTRFIDTVYSGQGHTHILHLFRVNWKKSTRLLINYCSFRSTSRLSAMIWRFFAVWLVYLVTFIPYWTALEIWGK